jgi:hypothetical protein
VEEWRHEDLVEDAFDFGLEEVVIHGRHYKSHRDQLWQLERERGNHKGKSFAEEGLDLKVDHMRQKEYLEGASCEDDHLVLHPCYA